MLHISSAACASGIRIASESSDPTATPAIRLEPALPASQNRADALPRASGGSTMQTLLPGAVGAVIVAEGLFFSNPHFSLLDETSISRDGHKDQGLSPCFSLTWWSRSWGRKPYVRCVNTSATQRTSVAEKCLLSHCRLESMSRMIYDTGFELKKRFFRLEIDDTHRVRIRQFDCSSLEPVQPSGHGGRRP